ncbi:hypothetical protein LCGC14_2670200 [marine sediment metagenome]|uniref:Uncharacterized protein n=1 Tax=marine sediment metagenome TaxID=412755 RepID=A0A0F8ZPC3_9ZZZZ
MHSLPIFPNPRQVEHNSFEFYTGLRQLKEEFNKIKENKSYLKKSDLGSFFPIYDLLYISEDNIQELLECIKQQKSS